MNSNSFICRLNAVAHLAITGQDATSFLHGQLTSDIEQLEQPIAQLSAHCNVKGRMVSLFTLFKTADGYHAYCPANLLDIMVNHLKKYALFSKVIFEDVSHQYQIFGVVGDAIHSFCETPPKQDFALVKQDDTIIIKLPGSPPRYHVITPQDRVIKTTDTEESWSLLDIQSGMAHLTPATSETFLPQMFNLEKLGGLSFSKGCFIGQEVIARAHHLGKVKRQMVYCQANGHVVPQPGDNVVNTETQGEAGKIVNAVLVDNVIHALAIIKTDGLKGEGLEITSQKITELKPL